MDTPIRPFMYQTEAISAQIDRALAALPPDAKGAVVAHYDPALGPRLSVVGRIGDHWSVVAEAWKPARGPIEGQAQVRFTW